MYTLRASDDKLEKYSKQRASPRLTSGRFHSFFPFLRLCLLYLRLYPSLFLSTRFCLLILGFGCKPSPFSSPFLAARIYVLLFSDEGYGSDIRLRGELKMPLIYVRTGYSGARVMKRFCANVCEQHFHVYSRSELYLQSIKCISVKI